MLVRIILVACVLMVVAQAFDLTSIVDKELNACAKKHNVKDAKKVLLDNIADPNAKCLKHCIGLQIKLISESGEPLLDKAPKDSEFTQYAQECSKQHKEADKCERVNKISDCLRTKSEQVMETYSTECAKETNTTVTNFKDLAKNPIINALNPKMHCYYRCLMMKTKAVDSEGNLEMDKAKPFLVGTKYEKVIEQVASCEKINNQPDVCMKSVQRVICAGQRYYISSLFG